MTITAVRRPRALREGDTIAIIAPAGPCKPERLEYGVTLLQEWGFRVRCLPSTEAGAGYLALGLGAGADRVKGEELTACFADPDIKGILCARGGYGTMRILPYVDWNAVRANPKWFGGYSDITGLHQAIRHEARLLTFHGPMAERQGQEPGLHPWTAAEWRRALTSTDPLGPIVPPPDAPAMTTIAVGRAAGPLVGGNLTLVASLAGTRWQLDPRGGILLLEDTNENPYRIDRMLTQLTLAGMFEGVRGVLFGDSADCDRPDDPRSFPLVQVLADRLGGLGVPVLYGFPCGHAQWRATLPLGARAELDAAARSLTILDAACV